MFTFTKKVSDIITSHKTKKPFFIYVSFQSVHEPIEVPKKYENIYRHVMNDGRRKYSGMVSAIDEAFGSITMALKEAIVFNNTLILFTTDNGGSLPYYGSNYPLRGGKQTLWEGGTRSMCFMSGTVLMNHRKKGPAPYTYYGLIHAVDWYPTLIAAAGGKPGNNTDGINQWDSIKYFAPARRTEFVYNIDDSTTPMAGRAAIRVGDYKLIEGYPGICDGWYRPMNDTNDTLVMDTIYQPGGNQVMLFNIGKDPSETNDLSKALPDVVKSLQNKLSEYRKQMVPAIYPAPDPASDPSHFGNVWSPGWC